MGRGPWPMELGGDESVKPAIDDQLQRHSRQKGGVPLIRIERISVDFGPSYPAGGSVAEGEVKVR